MEIEKILVLSTGHIPEPTADLPCDYYSHGGYGWLIYARQQTPEYPELNILLELARSKDCHWLLLDRDGPIEPQLPTYDW